MTLIVAIPDRGRHVPPGVPACSACPLRLAARLLAAGPRPRSSGRSVRPGSPHLPAGACHQMLVNRAGADAQRAADLIIVEDISPDKSIQVIHDVRQVSCTPCAVSSDGRKVCQQLRRTCQSRRARQSRFIAIKPAQRARGKHRGGRSCRVAGPVPGHPRPLCGYSWQPRKPGLFHLWHSRTRSQPRPIGSGGTPAGAADARLRCAELSRDATRRTPSGLAGRGYPGPG